MRLTRHTFANAWLIALTALLAVPMSVMIHNAWKRTRTIAVYDSQKEVVDTVIQEFADALRQDGYGVINDSTGSNGSGEWRKYAALTATDSDAAQHVCYVEIMGFVNHDDDGQPAFMKILPMRLSHRSRALNSRFLTLLCAELDKNGWEYGIDSKCSGRGWFSNFDSNHYLAKE